LPSIEQVMPWLHLVFDAWEDHRRMREREAAEREAAEAAEREAQAAAERGDASGDPDDDDHHKKKKRRKDKDKDKK
jgi:hypothetical protein